MKITRNALLAAITSLLAGTIWGQSVPIYSYSVTPTTGYTENNNLADYTDSLTGHWSVHYDGLNRISSMSSDSGFYNGLSVNWSYDSFGNRLTQDASGTSSGTLSLLHRDQTYGPDNKLWTNPQAPVRSVDQSGTVLSGVRHDDAGNVMFDGTSSYAFDAENRVCAVLQNGTLTQYLYDAEGRRIAKGHSASGSVLQCADYDDFVVDEKYVLDQNGSTVTRLNGSDNWKRSDIFANGRLLATYSQEVAQQVLHYQVTDPLGSKRVLISSDGSAEGNCRSMPFGDEFNCSTNTEIRYTGKERDTESGLDYFGARYYGSSMGRFQSPDPSGMAFTSLSNPQSFNMYSYVQNNPLNAVDPDGLDCVYINNDTGQMTGFNRGDCDNSTDAKANSGYYFDGTVNAIYTTTGDTSGQVVGVQGISDATGGGLYQANPAGLSFPQPNGNTSTSGMDTTINTWGNYSQTTQFNHGTHPFRDNNPGDMMTSGGFSDRHGAIGSDGRVAVFPTFGTGSNALDALLHTPKYMSMTVSGALAVFAPPNENNTAAYQQFIQNVVGVGPNTPVSSLSPAQFKALENGIARYEGTYAPGNYSVSVTTNF